MNAKEVYVIRKYRQKYKLQAQHQTDEEVLKLLLRVKYDSTLRDASNTTIIEIINDL